jgi:hypothetical protein
MDKNELRKYLIIKKDLMAKFSHYTYGNLYYEFEINDYITLSSGVFQFPIPVIEKDDGLISLSTDLGTTSFENEIKASLLSRWITKSLDRGELIKIK